MILLRAVSVSESQVNSGALWLSPSSYGAGGGGPSSFSASLATTLHVGASAAVGGWLGWDSLASPYPVVDVSVSVLNTGPSYNDSLGRAPYWTNWWMEPTAAARLSVTLLALPCPACPLGKYSLSTCYGGVDGDYAAWGPDVMNSSNAADALVCTSVCDATTPLTGNPCGSGAYVSARCFQGQSIVCSPCSVSCGPGRYMPNGPGCASATEDTQCRACTNTCANASSYVATPCDGVNDAVCAACDCEAEGTQSCAGPLHCTCKEGWAGPRCDTRPWTTSPSDYDAPPILCDARGTAAMSSYISLQPGNCICRANFAGAACDDCASGWYGPGCEHACSCGSSQMCDEGVDGSGACYEPAGSPQPSPSVRASSSYGENTEGVVYRNPAVQLAVPDSVGGGTYEYLVARENVTFIYALPPDLFLHYDGSSSSSTSPSSDNVTIELLVDKGSSGDSSSSSGEYGAGPPWLSLNKTVSGDGRVQYTLWGMPGRSDVNMERPAWDRASLIKQVMLVATAPDGASASLILPLTVFPAPQHYPGLAALPPQTACYDADWALNLSLPYGPKGYYDPDVSDGSPATDDVRLTFSALPPWMHVNLSTSTSNNAADGAIRGIDSFLIGSPSASDSGQTFWVGLTAQDSSGLAVTTTLPITVVAPPLVELNASAVIVAYLGQRLSWRFPKSTFSSSPSAQRIPFAWFSNEGTYIATAVNASAHAVALTPGLSTTFVSGGGSGAWTPCGWLRLTWGTQADDESDLATGLLVPGVTGIPSAADVGVRCYLTFQAEFAAGGFFAGQVPIYVGAVLPSVDPTRECSVFASLVDCFPRFCC